METSLASHGRFPSMLPSHRGGLRTQSLRPTHGNCARKLCAEHHSHVTCKLHWPLPAGSRQCCAATVVAYAIAQTNQCSIQCVFGGALRICAGGVDRSLTSLWRELWRRRPALTLPHYNAQPSKKRIKIKYQKSHFLNATKKSALCTHPALTLHSSRFQ